MVPILYWAQVYSVDDTLIPVFFFHPTMEILSFLYVPSFKIDSPYLVKQF
jgi:hypothetical protein